MRADFDHIRTDLFQKQLSKENYHTDTCLVQGMRFVYMPHGSWSAVRPQALARLWSVPTEHKSDVAAITWDTCSARTSSQIACYRILLCLMQRCHSRPCLLQLISVMTSHAWDQGDQKGAVVGHNKCVQALACNSLAVFWCSDDF